MTALTDMNSSTKPDQEFMMQSKFQTPTSELAEALSEVAEFVVEVRRSHEGDKTVKPHWLTLSGVSGCGKTMLAREALLFLAKRLPYDRTGMHYQGMYFRPLLELTQEWREGAYRNNDDESAFLLVIDDLGAERGTDFVRDRLFNLINKRLGKWTIITTNLKLSAIQSDYDTRIASRLIRDGNKYFPVKSGDYCLQKVLERQNDV